MFTAKLNDFYQFPRKNQRDDYREFYKEIYGDLMNEPAKEEVVDASQLAPDTEAKINSWLKRGDLSAYCEALDGNSPPPVQKVKAAAAVSGQKSNTDRPSTNSKQYCHNLYTRSYGKHRTSNQDQYGSPKLNYDVFKKNKKEAELTRERLSGNADTLARIRKSWETKQEKELAKQLSQVAGSEPKSQTQERPKTVGTMGEMQPSEMAKPETDHELDCVNPLENMSQSQLKEYMGEFAYYTGDRDEVWGAHKFSGLPAHLQEEKRAADSTQRLETTTSYMNSYGGNIAKLKSNVQKARAEKQGGESRIEVTAPYGKVMYRTDARKPKSGKMLIPSYLLQERLPKNDDGTSQRISNTMKKLTISSQNAERCLLQVATEDRKAAIKLGQEKTRSEVPLGKYGYQCRADWGTHYSIAYKQPVLLHSVQTRPWSRA